MPNSDLSGGVGAKKILSDKCRPDMAGDIWEPELGMKLHFCTVYEGIPVLCPCNMGSSEAIVNLLDGDGVEILNFPLTLQVNYGLLGSVDAVRVGGFEEPAFEISWNGITHVISYTELFEHGMFDEICVHVKKTARGSLL